MSKIEQIITEIEEYIDNCKFQPLSTSKIIVNKDDIDELLAELRLRTPDEIKKYQKIIANKDAILNDAKERAEAMVSEATAHINQLVSEHEIMQKAYEEANQIIEQATDIEADYMKKVLIEELHKALDENGIRQIWHEAKLRGRGYSRSGEILGYARASVDIRDGADAAKIAVQWFVKKVIERQKTEAR